jgi:microcystin-dependent protein
MSDFLNKAVGQMSRAELTRLISQVITRQVPPIPANLLALADADRPVTYPATAANGDVLTYDAAKGVVVAAPVTTGTTTSDGAPPGSSPTPTVNGGLGYLAVKWTPVANNDLVTYEVHLSTGGSGFAPGAGTKVGETPGASFFIRKDAAGVDLSYATDYWVKLIAKDRDSAAAAGSAGGPEQLDPAGTADILVGAIVAGHFEAIMALTSSLIAGSPTAERVEVGYGTDGAGAFDGFIGLRCFLSDGTTQSFYVDAQTGNVYVKGRLDFGDGSRLDDDMFDMFKQVTTGFSNAAILQSATHSPAGVSSVSLNTLPSPSTPGNAIIYVATMIDKDGTAPTPSTPAGFTLMTSETAQSTWGAVSFILYVWAKNDVTAPTTSASFNWNDSGYHCSMLLEVNGLVDVVGGSGKDKTITNEGGPTGAASSGTTATLSQAEEFALGFLACEFQDPDGTPTGGFTRHKKISVNDSGHVLGLGTYYQQVAATTALTLTDDVAGAGDPGYWIGAMVTFKRNASPADPPKPVADTVRHYVKTVDGEPRPYVITPAGPTAGLIHSVLVPAGVVLPFAGGIAPNGYLLCDGSSLLRSDYPALFAVLSTTYGSVDGTHFNLPDMRGRVPVALDNLGGSDAGRLASANTRGTTGGEDAHTLTVAELPVHNHDLAASGNWQVLSNTTTGGLANRVTTGGGPESTKNAGSGSTHENMPPFITMAYIIKY